MNEIANPFNPGAGSAPPQLAGREQILASATLALRRLKAGRPVRGQLMLGLRGVGKTVLLREIRRLAQHEGLLPISLEVPEDVRLAQALVPALRTALFALSRTAKAKALATEALAVLRSFASAFKLDVSTGELAFEADRVRGVADSGDLDSDLPALCMTVAKAAQAAGTPVVLLVDELQYLQEVDLRALIVAVHAVTQENLPFLLFGAGLPQLAALAGAAKSYAERLFEYPVVGPLDVKAAQEAIAVPIRRAHADIAPEALQAIVTQTDGYPYFLQEWGKHAWDLATGPRITNADVVAATTSTLVDLDNGFFRVRFDRLTPTERLYLRAMAHLGRGPHRSGAIAKALGNKVEAVGATRSALIAKGMIYSPAHGDTAFTVPMFDAFMHRAMPTWTPRALASAKPAADHPSPTSRHRTAKKMKKPKNRGPR
jgi:hypothetical protein